MADNTTVHIGENSPEQVAYKLMRNIADVEGKDISSGSAIKGTTKADRDWILTTYYACLMTVRAYDPAKKKQ